MKILLAIDDSKFSETAIDALNAQSRPKETEVRVLHVIEPMPVYLDGQAWGNFPAFGALQQEQRKEAEGLVARTAQKLRCRSHGDDNRWGGRSESCGH
jgi:Universal stress protein family